MFKYSKGKTKYDNLPVQCSADSFKELATDILQSVSPEKGQTFVCAAVSAGLHSDQEKYPDRVDHWRQQHLACSRKFLAFDFDGFESPTVWGELNLIFPWQGFLYTTASHSPEAPRARAFVKLSREVDHIEGKELGEAAQAFIESKITTGWIEFDDSVYRSTQPVYTPVVGFVFHLVKADVLDVDYILQWHRSTKAIQVFNKIQADPRPLSALGALLAPSSEIASPIPDGHRNRTMLAAAGRYRKQGLSQSAIEKHVIADNERWCEPPLDEEEVISIARRYAHQTQAQEDTGSIFTQDQQSANDNEVSEGQFDEASAKGVFTLEDGDLLLPAKAPLPRDYVFANSVTRGTAIMVGGLGGTSKTTLVMLMAIHSALGKNWGSLQIREGSSLLFLGEESADEKARRFGGLCADLKLAERQRVTERVRAFPAIGKDLRVTQSIAGDPHPTEFADEIIRLSLAHQAESGIELSFIVLDHTRLFMSGDPNAADDVSQLTRVLAYIANATQAVVVLIAHSPKSAMSKEGASDAAEIFGSGAFTDNTRGTFVLNTMRPEEAKTYGKDEYERSDYVCLTNVKANYGKAGGTWWFRKESVPDWQIGTLVPEVMYSTKLYPEFSGLSKRLVELVESKQGKLTVSKVRGLAGKSGALKASDREVRNTIDRMLDEGQLILELLTKEQRAERGLSANVKEVLNLPTAG
jgi:hypothetical protein